MYEIMEGLRKLIDLKDRENTDNSNEKDYWPEIEVVEDGALGGAIPKINSFKCEQCQFIAKSIIIMNKHVRQEHISTLYPCVVCDCQAKSMLELNNHKLKHVNDLRHSILRMFNMVKKKQIYQQIFQSANISSFYKNKGDKSDLNNDRGVFNVVKIRFILDKMVYSDIYAKVDASMSSSNIEPPFCHQ